MAFSPTGRFVIRLVVVSVLAGLAALRVALGDGTVSADEAVQVIEATIAAGALYAGIGAGFQNVEPHVGNKLDQGQ